MKENIITKHKDGVSLKMHNRRANIIDYDDSGILFEFKVLDGDKSPRSKHIEERGVVTTMIRLNRDTAYGVYLALDYIFNKK